MARRHRSRAHVVVVAGAALLLPDTKDSRSSIRCFAGKVSSSLTRMGGMPPMGPPPGAAAARAATFLCGLAHVKLA